MLDICSITITIFYINFSFIDKVTYNLNDNETLRFLIPEVTFSIFNELHDKIRFTDEYKNKLLIKASVHGYGHFFG